MSESSLTAPPTRRWWGVAVGIRLLIGIVALPLTPLLFRDDLLTLLAMRPTREFLLLGGFQVRAGDIELVALLLVSLPMLLLGNWVFFGLGRAYREQLAGDDLPAWLAQMIDPNQLQRLRRALARKGALLVVLARLAIFPATLLAAAAGASDMRTRRFLVADTTSTVLAYIEYVGAGYVLGRAYESAGPWITAVGVGMLLLILWVMGRAMRDEEGTSTVSAESDELAWPGEPQPETPSA